MVLAKVAGTKTVTRRLVKPQIPDGFNPGIFQASADCTYIMDSGKVTVKKCPYGLPGDLIYGKEAFTFTEIRNTLSATINKSLSVRGFYHADLAVFDETLSLNEAAKFLKWKNPLNVGKSPLFMFRSIARIWDEIVSVRVERLQDITDEDCMREGIHHFKVNDMDYYHARPTAPTEEHWMQPHMAYIELWDSLNGDRAPWSSNPFVWRIETKPTTAP